MELRRKLSSVSHRGSVSGIEGTYNIRRHLKLSCLFYNFNDAFYFHCTHEFHNVSMQELLERNSLSHISPALGQLYQSEIGYRSAVGIIDGKLYLSSIPLLAQDSRVS